MSNRELKALNVVADEARSNLETAREHSASLEQELRSAALQAELDRHRALDTLRAEHQKALEREQQLVDEEKKRAHDWIADLKAGFESETLNLRDKVSQLEKKLKTTEPDPAIATAHVPTARDDGNGSAGETPPTDSTVAPTTTAGTAAASPTVASGGAATVSDLVTPSTRGSSVTTTDAGSGDVLVKSMTELINVQMQAMTKAASVQSLPPLDRYTGEGSQAEDDGIDRWLERFDERVKLAEWSDEVKLYQLKAHLDKTASHVFRMFSVDEKSSYEKAADTLRKRFRPVDIEELRGLEFHRKVQENETVEQLGLELQRLGRKAFPSTSGRDFDRSLKGRFFQALLTKWQRKLGAPKPSETFQELYDRARTLEQHEKQYSAASVTIHGEKKNDRPAQAKQSRPAKPPQDKEQSASGQSAKPKDDSEPGSERSPSSSGGLNLCCDKCGRKCHLARHCRSNRPKQEASGRSDNSKVATVKALEADDSFTEAQLEEMLARCTLRNEREQVESACANTCTVMAESNETNKAVGPTYTIP